MEDIIKQLRFLKTNVDNINKRLEIIDESVTNINKKCTNMERKVDNSDEKITRMDGRIRGIEERFSYIQSKDSRGKEKNIARKEDCDVISVASCLQQDSVDAYSKEHRQSASYVASENTGYESEPHDTDELRNVDEVSSHTGEIIHSMYIVSTSSCASTLIFKVLE